MTKQIMTKIFVPIMLVTLIFSFLNCESKPDQLVEDNEGAEQFLVDDLIEEITFSEARLKESVITVEGYVEDVNTINNRYTILLKGKEQSSTSIICDMQENQAQKLENVKLGQSIKIRGIIKGSLKDVILLNCIIAN